MDDMKDKSIHFTAQKLTEEIQNMPVYKKFYSQIQVSLRFIIVVVVVVISKIICCRVLT
jgi:hypothetical protein